MPHAWMWRDADWQYAIDTIDLAVAAFQQGAKVGLFAELRLRERQMGTTWSARQDMRIRYVEHVDSTTPSATVTNIEDIREL